MVTKIVFEIPILCFIFVLLESSGPSGRYGATSEAFIFSLNNSVGLAPFLSKVKPGWVGRAIDRHLYYGPKFGQDLVIHVDAVRKSYSQARLGNCYTVPASVKDKGSTILAGTKYFSPDEVEVFYLDPSP